MIITCPHCQTKYQVTFEAIGSAGRKVQCAHCHEAWDQGPLGPQKPALPAPEDDRLFSAMEEDALDEAFVAEEQAALAEKPAKPLPDLPTTKPSVPQSAVDLRQQAAAFSRRQNEVSARLPLARFRRASRILGLVLLGGLVATGYFARVPIVERYPDLAGVYESVGLGVNVIGLQFSDLATLRTTTGGNDVLMVSAQIAGIEPHPMPVPPVVVSLLDEAGRPIYEWSVTPQVKDLMAGERTTFDTRLPSPPEEAARVRLSFAGGSTAGPGSEAPAEPTTATASLGTATEEHSTPSEPHAPAPEAAHGAPAAHH
jgi:predicted Zn finger-like uncharacterized protein